VDLPLGFQVRNLVVDCGENKGKLAGHCGYPS
jgi:hypothetical protein